MSVGDICISEECGNKVRSSKKKDFERVCLNKYDSNMNNVFELKVVLSTSASSTRFRISQTWVSRNVKNNLNVKNSRVGNVGNSMSIGNSMNFGNSLNIRSSLEVEIV